MKIACRCEKCNTMFSGSEEDAYMEFDFVEKEIRFYCRNQKCKHINKFDFSAWEEKQKKSPLPSIRIV